MEFTHTVPLALVADRVDLGEWIFGLTDEEYRASAKGHHAMGIIGGVRRLGIINVEEIAGTLIVQHYYTRIATADRVGFVSEASEGFLVHALPFAMKVWWDMAVTSVEASASELRCTIGFDAPGWVTAAGAVIGNNHFVHKHLVEETENFAKDIARKVSA